MPYLPFLKAFTNRYLPPQKTDQKGQALMEYLLLLAMMFALSLAFLKGVNGYLGDLWLFIANKIAYPTVIEFR